MGSSSYSADTFDSTMRAAAAAPGGAFAYSHSVSSGAVPTKVHELLDPARKNKAGVIIRESRDSDAHPESTAVAVLFDITGSMRDVPRLFVEKFPALMSLMYKKGYLPHPQILFGAIGDTCDPIPLQVGQFESGNEMDAALTNIVCYGGGGGQQTESYELAMYFLSRHAAMDCLEKRGKKGYLFLTGDELPYPNVKPGEVKVFIGEEIQAPIPLDNILAELREKFEVFWILPGGTANYNDHHVNTKLEKLFGQNLIKLADPANICETIAATIGVCEGYDIHSVNKDLVDVGVSAKAADAVTSALVPFTKSTSLAKVGSVDGTLANGGSDSVSRL